MGNLCSSRSEADPFTQPGRVLGSSSTQAQPAQQPSRVPLPSKANFSTPGRTLGAPATEDTADARAQAALAAQKRAEATSGKGKLGSKLAAQKAQTQAQTLSEASRDERANRRLDDTVTTSRWE
ncbi:hypothetical protein ASPZODRAFT_12773 [Penicilliopsis zonata CBS 506.65]|uniref:Uncharacterized protein n=1 Tax=Penicilliopsis zonata CBS 506.65 TaxID=1073090 RepID=A0A1L9SR99_9EURO|nr:hypothetical protein ASPZODRAFT_12773 [Penicilliopsis zonata CBS 506.65]OJJ49653.1 hypothetical protein ASPZODRAFT_12773 [Penicilliopsis zonata CBS 506.65]